MYDKLSSNVNAEQGNPAAISIDLEHNPIDLDLLDRQNGQGNGRDNGFPRVLTPEEAAWERLGKRASPSARIRKRIPHTAEKGFVCGDTTDAVWPDYTIVHFIMSIAPAFKQCYGLDDEDTAVVTVKKLASVMGVPAAHVREVYLSMLGGEPRGFMLEKYAEMMNETYRESPSDLPLLFLPETEIYAYYDSLPDLPDDERE